MQTIQTVLFILIFILLCLSAFFSFKFRRSQDPKVRGLNAAKMNMTMGIMLIAVACSQLFFFTDSNTRRIFGTVCVLLGLFNLFAGLRNHGIFTRMK